MFPKNYFALLLCLLFAVSCDFKSRKDADSNSSGDSLAYVQFADASVIDPSWPVNNVVVVHTISEPDNLHPTNGTSAIRAELFLYTQMELVQTNMRSPGVRPGLCKELPVISSDGLQYTYELRAEPKWDDGDLLSVQDVIFTAKVCVVVLTTPLVDALASFTLITEPVTMIGLVPVYVVPPPPAPPA